MYLWLLYAHIGGLLGLMLIHPVTVAFHLRDETDPPRVRMLLDITDAAGPLRGIFFLLVFASGIALGFAGDFWGRGWIWVSIGVLIAIGVVMGSYGRGQLDKIRKIPDDALMETRLHRWHAEILALVGVGGLAILLYLMIFKPF